jgi:hypothetical protein
MHKSQKPLPSKNELIILVMEMGGEKGIFLE